MQAGVVVDHPENTLKRRRTIEEYSDLHRACKVLFVDDGGRVGGREVVGS